MLNSALRIAFTTGAALLSPTLEYSTSAPMAILAGTAGPLTGLAGAYAVNHACGRACPDSAVPVLPPSRSGKSLNVSYEVPVGVDVEPSMATCMTARLSAESGSLPSCIGGGTPRAGALAGR